MSVVSKNEYWENEARSAQGQNQGPVYAFVEELTLAGEPILRFAGDSLPSQKIYVRLKSYIPAQGDMVMLIGDVIQGGWTPNAS